MKEKIDFLENGDYKFIRNLLDEKMSILRTSEKFEKKYTRLFDAMEELQETLNQSQKEKFNEIVELVYSTEEYYFAVMYLLGVKYGQDLGKI